MKIRRSLTWSIFALIAFASLGITVALYLICVNALKSTIADAELKRAEKSYNVTEAVVQEYVRGLSAIIKCLKYHGPLINAIDRDNRLDDFDDLKKTMDKIYTEIDVTLFLVTDVRERVLYRANAPNRYGDTPNTWGIKEALNGQNVITTTHDEDGWMLKAITPAIKDGKIIGAIMIGYRLDDDFARKILPGGNHIMLYDLDDLIACSNSASITEFDRHHRNLVLNSIKEHRVTYDEHSNFHVNHYYKRLNIADSSFGLVVEIDTSESDRYFTRTKYKIAWISGVIFLISLILGGAFSRRLVKPLRELQRQSDMTVTALTGRVYDTDYGDELDALVNSFNLMREMLVAHIARIEQVEKELRHNQKTLEGMVDELRGKNDKLNLEMDHRQKVEKDLKNLHMELMDASRRAGMAQVATDVLHNIGNVLNSINVASSFINDKLSCSKIDNLRKAVEMIMSHLDDISNFLTHDPKGCHIPVYLSEATAHIAEEQTVIREKLLTMVKNINHIKEIVKMQQTYARLSGVTTTMSPDELIDDAIQINDASLKHHNITVIRKTEDIGIVEIDKQRALQILVNLIDNAKDALLNCTKPEKIITIRSGRISSDNFFIEISDNGDGIDPANLSRIFEYGFTTKETGHGFGLHSSVLAAKEMGGNLTAISPGPGQGAVFTLSLPMTTNGEKVL